jgi:hypothetical protein
MVHLLCFRCLLLCFRPFASVPPIASYYLPILLAVCLLMRCRCLMLIYAHWEGGKFTCKSVRCVQVS